MCNKCLTFSRLIILVLIVAMILPVSVNATTETMNEPRASYYLSTYGSYIHNVGSGSVQVWFNVQGTGYMDELGALSIQIYECSTNSDNIEDWGWKKTFTYDSTPDMLASNDFYHSGHVDYIGRVGKYYKAYVCVWAGKDGKGDTRYFWTGAKKAT